MLTHLARAHTLASVQLSDLFTLLFCPPPAFFRADRVRWHHPVTLAKKAA